MNFEYKWLGKFFRKPLLTYTRDEIIFALSRNIMPWESPIHTAVRRGDLTNVKTLVTEKNVNSRSTWGFTPLNVACYCGHLEIINFLLDSGADVRLDDGEGWTPLHAACRSDRTDAVKLLLDRGAADSANMRAGNCDTPLFVACKSKGDLNGDVVQLLIGAGANVNMKNHKGRTPLMIATAKNLHKKVELLLNAGANVHAVDEKGMSALHMAVSCPVILRLLINAGADIDLKDNRGEIPLERKDICLEAIPILLEHGAGARVPCLLHKLCKASTLACLYRKARTSAKRGFIVDKFHVIEKHIMKYEVAGLFAGKGVFLVQPPVDHNYWNSVSRDEFRVDCETEAAMLKTEKIPGSNCTYFDVLLQRSYALKHIDPPSLENCRERFPIYGQLIWIRHRSGCRKLELIDECIDFFSVAEDVPQVPPECVAEVLSYLTERDLKTVVTIYNSARRQRAQETNENNKRANPDSSLQVMKYLKVE